MRSSLFINEDRLKRMVARLLSKYLILLVALIFLAPPGWSGRGDTIPTIIRTETPLEPSSTSHVPVLKVVQDSTRGVVLDISIPDFGLETVQYNGIQYHALHLDAGGLTSQVGAPQLPVLDYLIGIPKAASPWIHYELLQVDNLQGDFRLAPAPSIELSEQEGQPERYQYVEDPQMYTSQTVFPSEPVRLGADAWLRDQRVVRLEIYPFQVIPANGSLAWNRHLRVAVNFQPGSSPSLECLLCLPQTSSVSGSDKQVTGAFLESSAPFESALKGTLINYELARMWRAMPDLQAPVRTLEPGKTYYRIPINRDGLYRLTYENLEAAGLDVANLDPTHLHLTNQGREVARVSHNIDGDEHHFIAGEYLAFYGQKLYGDHLAELYADEDNQWLSFRSQDISGTYMTWTPQYNAAQVEKYTDENVYWLSLEIIARIDHDGCSRFAAAGYTTRANLSGDAAGGAFNRPLGQPVLDSGEWGGELVRVRE